MDVQVDHRVRWVREPSRTASLPEVDLPEHQPGFADRFGEQLRDNGIAIGIGGLALGMLAATRSARAGAGIVRTALKGTGAAMLGASLLASTGAGLRMLQQPAGPASSAPVATAAASETGEPLRVMTFNIHGGTGPAGVALGGSDELDRIAETIAREQPDVVLLQEVNDASVQTGFTNVLDELADRLDADGAVFVPAVRNATGREFGNGVLTFNGVEIADARGLLSPDVHGESVVRRARGMVDTALGYVTKQRTGTERTLTGMPEYRPRTTADVLVTTPEGAGVRVLSGHYSWPADGVDHPRRQIDPLEGLLGAWDGPTIIGADFNVKSGTEGGDLEAAAFAGAGMVDAFTAAGVALDDPARGTLGTRPGAGGPIDRIYGSEQLTVEDVRVGEFTAGEPAPSDHRPVIVDYELPGA